MKYDLNELRTRVKKRRVLFGLKISLILLSMTVFAVLGLLRINDTFTFISFVLEIPLILLLVSVFIASQAKVIFSGEIKGENISEDDYTVGVRPIKFSVARGGVNIPHTFENRKPARENMKCSVFVKLENGSIREIRGLGNEHLDIYEIGDILMKPSGARYPTVISRKSLKQPCPLCGEINTIGDSSCKVCGLAVINE